MLMLGRASGCSGQNAGHSPSGHGHGSHTPASGNKILAWLESRVGYTDLIKLMLDEPVPGGARWWYVFGAVLSFLLVVEVTTGVLLAAYYAPSAAVTEMVEAILKDKKKILPCAAYLEGEYGINGLFVGVPVKLGAKGIEQIIEIKLTPEEKAALDKSAAAVKELVAVIGV